MKREIHFIVPGDIDQLTGGFIYAKRIINELRLIGRNVILHELSGELPNEDTPAKISAKMILDQVSDNDIVIIDWLGIIAFEKVLEIHHLRVIFIALIHNPVHIDSLSFRKINFEAFEIKFLSMFQQVIVTSEYTAELLRKYTKELEINTVNPGIDIPAKINDSYISNSKHTIKILSVGSLIPRKGIVVLIEALSQLKEIKWELICVGNVNRNKEYVENIKMKISSFNLIDRIKFTGNVSPQKLSKLFQSSDIFVLPSYFESYGMVLAEAMIYSLPIITTNAGAIPYTVSTNSAILIKPGSVNEMVEALYKLMTDIEFRKDLAKKSKKAGKQLLTWSDATKKFDSIVNKVKML